MRGFQLGFSIGFLMLSSACGHSSSPSVGSSVVVPNHVTLNIPPSQPLSSDEYAQFVAFISKQNQVGQFLPQLYVFSTAPDRSQLSPQQSNLLTQIQNDCVAADLPVGNRATQVAGATEESADIRTILGGNCPLLYKLQSKASMTIVSLNAKAKTMSGDGTFETAEALRAQSSNSTAASMDDDFTNKMTASYVYQVSASDERMFLNVTDEQNVLENASIAASPANRYTEKIEAQILLESQTNSITTESMQASVNLSLRLSGMSKTIVVSLLLSSDGNPNNTTATGYLNGVKATADQLTMLTSSSFIQTQLGGMMTSLGYTSGNATVDSMTRGFRL